MVNVDNNKSYTRELVRLNNYNLVAVGYQKLVITGATAQSLTIPTDANYAEMRLESSITATVPIRYLLLGGKILPTTIDGLPLNNFDIFDISGTENLSKFRAIESTVGTHTLHIQYYK